MTDISMSRIGDERHPNQLQIESLDLDAQGIAHKPDGKVVFIEGALPYEIVTANIHKKKNNWEQGVVAQILQASSQRVKPGCQYFGLHSGSCGGCKMQHLNTTAQVSIKQRVLENNLWHLGKVKPDQILRPLQGPDWGYRYRARLSVRYVAKKSKVLIGFHERKSRYVADIESCQVLPPHMSDMLMELRELINSLDARDQCPQIEMACGDKVTALILRHLVPLTPKDKSYLAEFGLAHRVQWWLQPKGPDSIELLQSGHVDVSSQLSYALPQFGLQMEFRPTDFTQVNPHINQVMVERAIKFLDIQPEEFVIDWFCGLGNFTLPIATQARKVLGVEGSSSLLDWANHNYSTNSKHSRSTLCSVRFDARNLFDIQAEDLIGFGTAEKWLIDPPREGAFALVKALAELSNNQSIDRASFSLPSRIVYISCNPSTLARDAEVLVHQAGYQCSSAGVLNMFPHTAHVESMAIFELAKIRP